MESKGNKRRFLEIISFACLRSDLIEAGEQIIEIRLSKENSD